MNLRYTDKKYLDEAINALSEKLINLDGKENVLTESYAGYLSLLDVCSSDLSKIGSEKLKQIKEVLGREKLFPEIAITSAEISNLHKRDDVTRGEVEYGLRALLTYQTLLKYQEKIEELNKVRQLEKILGE